MGIGVIVNKMHRVIAEPKSIIYQLLNTQCGHLLSDRNFLKIKFYLKTGRPLNLQNPQIFNEKLQYLKIHDRKPEYTQMVDKYEVRKHIAETIGEEYLIPLLGVWDNFDDIDFDSLPNQFVLKCTHDSGGLVICRDKSKLDIPDTKKKINKCLKRNYYWSGREWPYKNVKPRIIAEKYMVTPDGQGLNDYKFYCFNGEVKLFHVNTVPESGRTCDLFDPEGNHLELTFGVNQGYSNAKETPTLPVNLAKLKELATQLSRDLVFARIDFYENEDQIYFGEITFYPASGMKPCNPQNWDYTLGEWIDLSNISSQ